MLTQTASINATAKRRRRCIATRSTADIDRHSRGEQGAAAPRQFAKQPGKALSPFIDIRSEGTVGAGETRQRRAWHSSLAASSYRLCPCAQPTRSAPAESIRGAGKLGSDTCLHSPFSSSVWGGGSGPMTHAPSVPVQLQSETSGPATNAIISRSLVERFCKSEEALHVLEEVTNSL